ncbi:hypothetical protein Q7X31_00135 [Escherichia coli]|nr:hypothetical protein [Escherichia coli]
MKKEISAQSLNANPLNWSLTRNTPWHWKNRPENQTAAGLYYAAR